jgi:hypothetical protein
MYMYGTMKVGHLQIVTGLLYISSKTQEWTGSVEVNASNITVSGTSIISILTSMAQAGG